MSTSSSLMSVYLKMTLKGLMSFSFIVKVALSGCWEVKKKKRMKKYVKLVIFNVEQKIFRKRNKKIFPHKIYFGVGLNVKSSNDLVRFALVDG